jgi:hypothetical protein
MKQTFINLPNTAEVFTKTVTTNPAGQKKATFALYSTIKVQLQSGTGSRRNSRYVTEVDSYSIVASHVDSSLITYNNRLKNIKDRDGNVIEEGPLEFINIEKKVGVSGKVNHVIARVVKVKEGSEND